MKQKLMLLSMYIANPNLIILDEPTTGLDPLSLNDLKNILLEFKNINKTIILASRDMGFCQSISDEFAIIQNGTIIHKGLNKEVDDLLKFSYRNYKNSRILIFIKFSERYYNK